MLLVRQRFPESPPLDMAAAVREGMRGVLGSLEPGAEVALAVGSRGIANLAAIVRAVADALREAGARPFVVPAMGSHGGGTPAGQTTLLAGYGVSENQLGLPVRAGVGVERLGTTPAGFEVCCSTEALRAKAIVLVNRVKPHTDFSGRLGSGLLKMLVVGLGKPRGAANFHAAASRLGYETVLRESARLLLAKVPVLCGVAIVENQRHQTARVAVLPPGELEAGEEALVAEARSLMPRVPLDDIDLLMVDRMGKNISGTGMDPAVIGRSIHGYSLSPEPAQPPPRVRRLFVRDLTPETRGNATGIGLADFTTARLVRAIDWHVTKLNALTALSLQGAKVPIHFETDREAIAAALGSLGLRDWAQAVVVRVADTLSLERIEISESCREQVSANPALVVEQEATELTFNVEGNLIPRRGEGWKAEQR
jgi:hypothetical protein